MTEKKEFCQCLDFLLSTLGISISSLAKAINVDSSLVSRWVNGKRVPVYNTVYIENMSEYLAKKTINSIQMKKINNFFIDLFGDNKATITIAEKIRKILLESQGYSIENKKKSEKEEMIKSNRRKQTSKNNGNQYHENHINFYNKNSKMNANFLSQAIDFTSEDKILLGIDNILSSVISLLELAENQKAGSNNKIYITYSNNLDIASQQNNLLVSFRNTLLTSIANGWSIVFLVGLDNNTGKTIRLINFIKPLLVTGKVSLYYIDRHDIFIENHDSVIVSEIGALLSFCINLNPKVDNAFCFRSKYAVEVLQNHFDLFISTYGRPIINYFSQENSIDYSFHLVKNENSIGNRFLYKYSFSVLTLPKGLYEKLLRKKGITESKIQVALDFYDKRLSAFIQNIQLYEYTDIYFIDFVSDLIRYRRLNLYDYTGIELIDLELEDIIEILNNIVYLLETYSNYKIAFISSDIDSTVEDGDLYCLVKERKAVFLEAFNPSKTHRVQLEINEPTIVMAFEEYFRNLMRKVSPLNKDKKEVISWLNKQIYLIKSNYSK